MNIFRGIGKFLSTGLKSRKGPPTLESAFKKILSREQRNYSQRLKTDRRLLLSEIAAHFRLSEVKLAYNLAVVMRLAFVQRVVPLDISKLPVSLSFSEFRRLGCIPIQADGMIVGVACVDPYLVRKYIPALSSVPLSIALWSSIANALNESEEAYISKNQKKAPTALDVSTLCVRALGMICDEIKTYQAKSFTICLGGANEYKFFTADGRAAKGKINSKIAINLQTFLEANNNSALQLTLKSGNIEDIRIARKKLPAASSDYVIELLSETYVEPVAAEENINTNVIAFPERQSAIRSDTTQVAESLPNTSPADEWPTILIVEDNDIFARVLERFFSKHEMLTCHVSNGVQAVEFLKNQPRIPDLIVCDVHMPEMNGFEFLHRLRNDLKFVELPVVMLTSDNDIEAELQLLVDGADLFVSKNDDPRLLCVKVKKLIDKSKSKKAA